MKQKRKVLKYSELQDSGNDDVFGVLNFANKCCLKFFTNNINRYINLRESRDQRKAVTQKAPNPFSFQGLFKACGTLYGRPCIR